MVITTVEQFYFGAEHASHNVTVGKTRTADHFIEFLSEDNGVSLKVVIRGKDDMTAFLKLLQELHQDVLDGMDNKEDAA